MPLIVAVSGPPKICVHAVSAGVGARSAAEIPAAAPHAWLSVGALQVSCIVLAGGAAVAVGIDGDREVREVAVAADGGRGLVGAASGEEQERRRR